MEMNGMLQWIMLRLLLSFLNLYFLENLKGACYTGAKNETKSECTVLVDNGKIIFESDSAF